MTVLPISTDAVRKHRENRSPEKVVEDRAKNRDRERERSREKGLVNKRLNAKRYLRSRRSWHSAAIRKAGGDRLTEEHRPMVMAAASAFALSDLVRGMLEEAAESGDSHAVNRFRRDWSAAQKEARSYMVQLGFGERERLARRVADDKAALAAERAAVAKKLSEQAENPFEEDEFGY